MSLRTSLHQPRQAAPVPPSPKDPAAIINQWAGAKIRELAPDPAAVERAFASNADCALLLKEARGILQTPVIAALLHFLLKWAILPGTDNIKRMDWVRGLIHTLLAPDDPEREDLSDEDGLALLLDTARDYFKARPLPTAEDNALIGELLSLSDLFSLV